MFKLLLAIIVLFVIFMLRNMAESATPPSDPGAAAVAYEATPNPEPDSTAAAPANTVDPRANTVDPPATEEKAERVRFKDAIPGMVTNVQTMVVDSMNPLSMMGSGLSMFGMMPNKMSDKLTKAGAKTTKFVVEHNPFGALFTAFGKKKSARCKAKKFFSAGFAKC